ncbi:GNAT family N-acetyltransferase [Halobacteriaceae archaeon GCM10025711]
MPGAAFLHGERVTLHTVEREDLAFLQRHWNHPDVRRRTARVHPENGQQVTDAFEESDADGVRLLACADGDRIGVVSLFDVDEAAGRAELVAWLTPERRGNGYATEAAGLLVDYAFDERRLHRLEARALATDDEARAVVETLGFEQEGRLRDEQYVDGEYVDRVVYGLLEAEWRA